MEVTLKSGERAALASAGVSATGKALATVATAFAILLAAGVPAAHAQHAHGAHGKHGAADKAQGGAAPTIAQAAGNASDIAEGEVRRVDRSGGRVTLRHGEIQSLGMPPMTMVFRVKDPALLDGLKVGDTIRFRADQEGSTYFLLEVVR
jgi:Cu(I)/Ag(I) efflux system periplasmic protein CusF